MPQWKSYVVCGAPMTSWRPPASEARREELAVAYARDGYALLEAVYDRSAPPWLREPPAVGVLRRCCCRATPASSAETGGR